LFEAGLSGADRGAIGIIGCREINHLVLLVAREW
jgi:hypothetical protein